jgi:hypothetical protein
MTLKNASDKFDILARLIESGLELVAHNILENLDVLDLVSIS